MTNGPATRVSGATGARSEDGPHHVFLIPGFFGFANFGDFKYFWHVREVLEERFRVLGLDVRLHPVRTSPTASIRTRAERLAEIITAADTGEGPIHLIGHSTGGLDARLLVTPGVSLHTRADVEAIARRVRTVVAVTSPHYGTPLASFFASMLGQKALELVSLATIYVLRFGKLPLKALTLALGAMVWTNNRVVLRTGVLDQVHTMLLADFTEDRRALLDTFFSEVMGDQSLLPQLSPEGIDLFNALASRRDTVRYGCVVTAAPPPGLRTAAKLGLGAYAQLTYGLYRALYSKAASMRPSRIPPLTPEQWRALRQGLGRIPAPSDNDGMVPALSQVYGDVIHAAWADHLDVIGHFGDWRHDPPHVDWLITGAKFDRGHFERLWGDVARYVAG